MTTGSGTLLADLAIRVGPVLIFLVAITVVAEIADTAGVFDIAGHWAARRGRWTHLAVVAAGRRPLLPVDDLS